MNRKKKKLTIIIAAIVAVMMIAAIGIFVFISGSDERELKNQLNLGHKYLAELDYEQAIACFKKAIEIDLIGVDAYLGVADSYIAMAKDSLKAEDYDSALVSLDEAKSILEKGIDIIINEGSDASLLSNKFDEVISEIERVKKEVKAKRKRKAEEERLAAMPYIEIQPILDCLDDVWGRNWLEWTPEEFIKEFNLKDESYTYNNILHKSWGSDDGKAWMDENDDGIFMYERGKSIEIKQSQINFQQTIWSTRSGDIGEGTICNFTSMYGINNVNDVIKYFGIENVEIPLYVNTEYGEAHIGYFEGDGLGKFQKQIMIAFIDELPGMQFSFVDYSGEYTYCAFFAHHFGH